MTEEHGLQIGSGFCISPNLIVTNRHIVERATPSNLKIVGMNRQCKVAGIELDATNNLAILQVSDTLKPLRLGEFKFVEPGAPVLAIGFLAVDTSFQNSNIYISNGLVSSIRKIAISPERVIFTNAKIKDGMFGGPLIDDLGEVIGIITTNITSQENIDSHHSAPYLLKTREYELKEFNLLRDKIHTLRTAKITETDPETKFKLEQHLEQTEKELGKIEEKLEEMGESVRIPSIKNEPVILPIYLIDKYLNE